MGDLDNEATRICQSSMASNSWRGYKFAVEYKLELIWLVPVDHLRPCYTVKQASRYLYHATFCIMILVSLHTKSSSMFHAELFLQIVPAKMENPENEDIIIQIEETLHLFL
jgi:hypothetical protein